MSKPGQKSNSGDIDGAKKCVEEMCKANGKRAGFCDEHFVWFKEGLITTHGQRPRDFDKKYQAFVHRKSKSA